jgi:hypothetical protein
MWAFSTAVLRAGNEGVGALHRMRMASRARGE